MGFGDGATTGVGDAGTGVGVGLEVGVATGVGDAGTGVGVRLGSWAKAEKINTKAMIAKYLAVLTGNLNECI